jgi:hypothetical protein
MSDFTTHFDDDAWIAFVRGRLPAPEQQAMGAHLENGCAECRQTHETWQRFEKIVNESGDEGGDSATRVVKAAFTLRRRIPFRAGQSLTAERVFDSFVDPLPIGIRGSVASPRQLLYGAGDFLIDLRIEEGVRAPGTITGQVVRAQSEGAACGAGIVLVREPDEVVVQTIANSIGEFQVEFEHRGHLTICVGIPDGPFIEVPLPVPVRGPAPPGGSPGTWEANSELGGKE